MALQRKGSCKNQKGLVSEPLPAKPHFTPFRNKPERINHPGKNQNHLTALSANRLPHYEYLITFSQLTEKEIDMGTQSYASPSRYSIFYSFSHILTLATTDFWRIQAPMAVRMAEASVSAQSVTSSACSASTMTRALGSVPE